MHVHVRQIPPPGGVGFGRMKGFLGICLFCNAVSRRERSQMLPPRETWVSFKCAPTHAHLADAIFMTVCL